MNVSWTFSDLTVALLKYCNQPRHYKISIQPEWSTNPHHDSLLLSNQNQKFVFRINRLEWDHFYEFSIAPIHGQFQRSFFRIDLTTGLPVQVHKYGVNNSTGLWGNDTLPHDSQEFAKEIFDVIQTLYKENMIALNQSNATLVSNPKF